MVVGSPNDDDRRGSAYVYQRNKKGGWRRRAKLRDANRGVGDRFGRSVAINRQQRITIMTEEDRIPRIYERNGKRWEPQVVSGRRSLAANGNFTRTSVAMFEDTLITGACTADSDGSAYIYARSVSWEERAQLIPDTSQGLLNGLGTSVGIFGRTAVVGSPFENGERGAVYVFTDVDGDDVWTQQARLVASNSSPGLFFGWDVDIFENTLIVGTRSELAYIFTRDEGGTTWIEASRLTDTIGGENNFGESVAIYGDNSIVGAYGTNDETGVVLLFEENNVEPTAEPLPFPTYSPSSTPEPTTMFPTITPTFPPVSHSVLRTTCSIIESLLLTNNVAL